MSDFYLIRHGEHDWLKKGIAGRIPGVSLNARGKAQAKELLHRLEHVNFDVIYSSPLERAMEVAWDAAGFRSARGGRTGFGDDLANR